MGPGWGSHRDAGGDGCASRWQVRSQAREMAGSMSVPRSMVRMRMVDSASGKFRTTYSRKGICNGRAGGGGGVGWCGGGDGAWQAATCACHRLATSPTARPDDGACQMPACARLTPPMRQRAMPHLLCELGGQSVCNALLQVIKDEAPFLDACGGAASAPAGLLEHKPRPGGTSGDATLRSAAEPAQAGLVAPEGLVRHAAALYIARLRCGGACAHR